MPVRLFQLRGVPEDEAEEVRDLLQRNAIVFYETPPGNWGISSPALWLNDDADADRARNLIDDYQAQRALRERARYEALKAEGAEPTVWRALRRDPLKVIGLAAVAALVAYLSIAPFVDLD